MRHESDLDVDVVKIIEDDVKRWKYILFLLACLIAVVIGVGGMLSSNAQAMKSMPPPTTGLIMIHSPYCVYCKAFLRDTNQGATYDETDIGQVFPLIILDISNDDISKWIKGAIRAGEMKSVRGTPTFIFWKDAKEIGRIVGYSGPEWFQTIEKEYNKIDDS